ncbi:unnamed protein product, partial [Iphiclides podalirius]
MEGLRRGLWKQADAFRRDKAGGSIVAASAHVSSTAAEPTALFPPIMNKLIPEANAANRLPNSLRRYLAPLSPTLSRDSRRSYNSPGPIGPVMFE